MHWAELILLCPPLSRSASGSLHERNEKIVISTQQKYLQKKHYKVDKGLLSIAHTQFFSI